MDLRPQFSWDDGRLWIRSPQVETRIRWQPEPLAEEKLPGRPWQPFWPHFRLLPAVDAGEHGPRHVWPIYDDAGGTPGEVESAARKRLAFAALRAEIPEPIARLAAPFPSHQWPLLVLMHRQPAALDLAEANPVVAYGVANNHEFRGTSSSVAGELAVLHCHHKQRAILKWLGFPGSEAIVRLVKKIPPPAVSPFILRCLRAALGDPAVLPLLAHQPRLNGSMIYLAVRWQLRPLLTASLFASVLREEDDAAVVHEIDAVVNSLNFLATFAPGADAPRPFTSMAQMRRFNERIPREYQAYLRRRAQARAAVRQEFEARQQTWEEAGRPEALQPYPPEPVPGTRDIVPLRNPQELEDEGAQQHNCVATYAHCPKDGAVYFYRVLAPERATLSVVRGPDGCWRRCELKGCRNRRVTEETVAAIDRWLATFSLSVT